MQGRQSKGHHRPVPAQLRGVFGERLRALRRVKKLSQEGLGKAAGLSGKFIGEVERGEKSISIDSLHFVARALTVTLPALVSVRDDEETSQEAEELYALALKQSPHKQGMLLAVARACVGVA